MDGGIERDYMDIDEKVGILYSIRKLDKEEQVPLFDNTIAEIFEDPKPEYAIKLYPQALERLSDEQRCYIVGILKEIRAEDGKMFGDRINWILSEANAE